MAKKSRADKPHDPLPMSNPAYLNSGLPIADCMRAEVKISQILREKLQETRVTAEQLLVAMLPVFKARKKIEITESGVRDAVRKVLETE